MQTPCGGALQSGRQMKMEGLNSALWKEITHFADFGNTLLILVTLSFLVRPIWNGDLEIAVLPMA